MTTRDVVVPELEEELVCAVDAIISALSEGGRLESDAEAAVRTLETYLGQQNRIAAAAERHRNAGLHTACALMKARVLDLAGRGTALSAGECDLLYGWPSALVEYCAAPADPESVTGLVAHLSSPVWSSPLPTVEAEALERMMLNPGGRHPGSEPAVRDAASGRDGADGQGDGRPDAPAPMGSALAGSCSETAWMTAGSSFSRIPISTRVAWMADLAGRKGLGGIQEVCERAGRAVSVWEAQDGGISETQRESLEELLRLAKDALEDAYNPALAERLLASLGGGVWPEALVDDEREILTELLQADMLVLEPLADRAAESDFGEQHAEGPVAGGLPAESDEPACALPGLQTVSGELVALLAGEIEGARDSLQQALDAACAGEDASAGEAADQYAEEVQRIGAAAGTVGLGALHGLLARLKHLFTGRADPRPTAQQRDVLMLLPGALAAYLAAPTDRSTAEGLVDLLRSDAWDSPLPRVDAARLVQALGLVRVSEDVAAGPARETEARREDVSLAFPPDINQELLDGLLLELPVQTGEFSNAMQNIAGGSGSLGDLDTARRAAHTLKGAANTVGVRGIANLTHQLEDILIALSAHRAMPGGALGESLVRASDCLEAMSEAVTGAGPEPDDALAVLQDVLNWANRIDREGMPGTAETACPPQVAEPGNPQESAGATTPSAGPTVRVSAALIDELLRLVGETTIATGQIRERLMKLARDHQAMREQAGSFLRLTNELEELVDIGVGAGQALAKADTVEFDPLEFDHYSELHSVSRRLIESATDAREMGLGIDEDLSELRELAEAQERIHQQTRAVVMQTRMVPVATVLPRLQRGVRQACRLLDKEANLHVSGGETLIDSNVLNELIDPLMHVLRNAVDHGIEPARVRSAAGKPSTGDIRLAFAREGNQVVVRCRDDGSGLDFASIRRSAQERGLVTPEHALSDDELARLILAPGFSTRDEATQVSGRGIGMDIVSSRIQQMKGSLSLHSLAGSGLTVEMRLPAALISTHALIIRSRASRLALSSHGIQDIHYVLPEQLQVVAGSPTYRIGDNQLQVVEIEALLGLPGDQRREPRKGFPLLIVRLDSGTLRAVRVQEVLQSRDLVVKALGRYVPKLRGVVGATILGDGSVAPVLDLPETMATPPTLSRSPAAVEAGGMRRDHGRAATSQRSALVVDDSLSARRATAQFMKDAGFTVRTAIDGLEAVSILEKWKPDVMLVDMEMPRMSGLELTTHVRASTGALAHAPIIMITSRSTAKHRKQAEAAGVSVYLTKPFSDEELLGHLTRLTMAQHGS